ncbi:hypothetical protein LSAT2_028235, partial [Lamellibrachia satsuma]
LQAVGCGGTAVSAVSPSCWLWRHGSQVGLSKLLVVEARQSGRSLQAVGCGGTAVRSVSPSCWFWRHGSQVGLSKLLVVEARQSG